MSAIFSDLADISPPLYDVDLYLIYARTDNFAGRPLCKADRAYLHKDTAQALQRAIRLAAVQNLHLRIYDALRSHDLQWLCYEIAPDKSFWANPMKNGSDHSRGIAVDVTLLDKKSGQELDMGGPVDDFSQRARHDFPDLTTTQKQNRLLLLDIMKASGFQPIPHEWWHYDLAPVAMQDGKQNFKDYPLIWETDLPAPTLLEQPTSPQYFEQKQESGAR